MTTLHKVYAISLHCSPVVSHPQKSSLLASSHSCEGHKFLSELLSWSFRLPLSSKNEGVPHHRNSYRANLHTKCIALPSSSQNSILSYQHYRDRFPTLGTLRCCNTKGLLTLLWPRWPSFSLCTIWYFYSNSKCRVRTLLGFSTMEAKVANASANWFWALRMTVYSILSKVLVNSSKYCW